MFLLFDLIFFIYILVYLPFAILKGKAHSGFLKRFGRFSKEVSSILNHKKNIWVHAVSVGEVYAIRGIIERLKKQYPDHQIVFTVTTQTGYALANKIFKNSVVLLWSPLDLSLVVLGYIRKIKPVLYIIAETEIWPNQFYWLNKKNTPIVIVNGRISDLAFPKYLKVKNILSKILAKVDCFCMQSDEDAQKIVQMGADRNKVCIVGNVKWDDSFQNEKDQRGKFGLKEKDLVLLGGSTHPGEEELLLDVFKQLKTLLPSLKLVITPRHVERASEIEKLIKDNHLVYTKLSSLVDADILLIDSIGHLKSLYALADVVFVGKSLRKGGGQNIIEPALVSKPIIVGPKMENFRAIVDEFKKSGAIKQISSDEELLLACRELLVNKEKRDRMGVLAKKVVDQNKGAVDRTLAHIIKVYS